MKDTMKFLRIAAAVLALSAFASCEENAPDTPDTPDGPETPVTPDASGYPEKDMTFVVNGVETQIGSAYAFSMNGYVVMMASPDKVEFEELFSGDHEYIQVSLLPQDMNRDIDLKTETIQIYVLDLESGYIGPLDNEMYESGKTKIVYDESTNEYTLLVSLAFPDGTEVGVNASAIMDEPVPEEGSTITVNGTKEPVRAAFYDDPGNGTISLYFTSAAIGYFEEINLAYEYFFVALDEDDLTGGEFDITNTTKKFTVFYVNQRPDEESSIYFTDDDLDGAQGTINVSRNATSPEQFSAYINVTFGDKTSVIVDFEGTCLSTGYKPEEPVKSNEFVCFGSTEQIKSILVDKSDDAIWHIYLTATPGLDTVDAFVSDWAFHITAPSEAFDGDTYGFSTYKDILKFEYDGNTWQFSNNDTGSITATLEDGHLELDFMANGGEVTGHYSGTAVIVE